jgi:hypothetical protein
MCAHHRYHCTKLHLKNLFYFYRNLEIIYKVDVTRIAGRTCMGTVPVHQYCTFNTWMFVCRRSQYSSDPRSPLIN